MHERGASACWPRPLRWLACVLALALPAVLAAQPAPPAPPAQPDPSTPPVTASFSLTIEAPEAVREVLQRHLDLLRFRDVPDLTDSELTRLVGAAEDNTRDLLGTLGYFSPVVQTRRSGANGRDLRLSVEPGAPTRVREVTIHFAGAIEAAGDTDAARQRRAIQNGWALRAGEVFTQSAWDDAKTQALRQLTAQRYPVGRIAASQADIDADTGSARLSLTLDSGPLYRFGPLRVTGLQRYDPLLVPRLARLAPGTPYNQAEVLEAQQRLASSGYFDAVLVALDTTGDPAAAPVDVQLREAQRQKIVMGVGASTDSGLRLALEHTHHRVPGLGWRAVTKGVVDRETRVLTTELTSIPDASFWRWNVSGMLAREETGGLVIDSQRLRAGRSQTSGRHDFDYYLQYDRARARGASYFAKADALSANVGWTLRHFETMPFPTRGWGLGGTLGGGYTVDDNPQPFVRATARWLGFVPLGSQRQQDGTRTRLGRLALRAEGGVVVARRNAELPTSQLFLTGGDTTVRGYGLNEIGVIDQGATVGGRYLAVGSVEWQRPLAELGGLIGGLESVLFVDAGAVANRSGDLKPKVGLGAGVRWRSPIGPLQADIAWGEATRKFRVHLKVGFTF